MKLTGGYTIWDSLAILEFLAERHSKPGLGPRANGSS
jgi:glutathione S-transferase